MVTYRDRLAKTGLFSTINVAPAAPDETGAAPILVTLDERKPRTIGAGVSYSTAEGPGGRLFFENRNIFSQGENLRIEMRGSRLEQSINFDVIKPLPTLPGQMFGNFEFANETTDAFNARTVAVSGGLAKKWLNDRLETRGALALETSNVKSDGTEERTYFVSTPLAAIWNSENDPLDPTSGFRAAWTVTPYTGSDTFTQTEFTARSRVNFGGRYTLAARGALGATFGSSLAGLPLNKRFYAGGGGSVRGFSFQEAGPLDADNDPIGGRSLIEAAIEARAKVSKNIQLVGFVDAGSVSAKATPNFNEKFFVGVGGGARYLTPIGPIRVDVAFPLDKRETDRAFQIFIALGQTVLMRHFIILISTVIGALIIGALISLFILFNTDTGRNFIIAQAEPRLGEALNSEAKIGALTGAPPGRIVLSDITLSDSEGPWLTIEEVKINWRPLKLLTKNVDANLISIDRAHLLRPPLAKDEAEDEEPNPLKISLPDDLPYVRVSTFTISNFVTELGAESAILNGAGAMAIGGRRINGRLLVNSSNDQDIADITINLDPRDDRIFIDATVAAQADGVISTLSGLNGALVVEAKGDAPINNAAITLNGAVADYGSIDAILTGDLDQMSGAALEGVFQPGAALSDIEELSGEVRFAARIDDTRRGAAVTISELATAAGTAAGEISWINDRRGVKTLSANLTAQLAEGYRTEIQDLAGSELTLGAVLERLPENYGLNATLTGAKADLVIADGVTDLSKTVTGDIATNVAPGSSVTPALSNGAALIGFLDADFEEKISLTGLNLKLDDASSFSGDAAYALTDNPEIKLDGDAVISPALLSALAPSVEAQSPVVANINFNGPLDRFSLTAAIETPVLSISGDTAPPLAVNIAMNGLPQLPTGDITARASNGEPGQFNASLRSSANGRVNVPALTYIGPNFKLNGSGAFNPERQRIEIDLAYNGDRTAQPWPGVSIAGDLTVKGALTREGAQSDFTLSSTSLNAMGVGVANLNATAKGPPTAISVNLSADDILAGGQSFADLKTNAIVNAEDTISVRLQSLEALVDTVRTSLRQPATITLDDGATISGLRIGWGRNGEIALDGAFSSSRWKADASLTNITLPQTDGQANLIVDLDTDRQTAAQGNFRLRSLITQDQEAAISGTFSWDGAALNLISTKDADALDMNLSIPVRLIREPSIDVEIDGALSGEANYDGEIDVIAGYLPPSLQSLEGALKASFQIAGTIDAPRLSGRAAISDGAYTEPQSGFSLAGLHTEADASFSGGESVIKFTGGARGADQSGDDTINLTGNLTLNDASTLNLTVALNDTELSVHPVRTIRATGEIKVAGPLDNVSATGKIRVDELDAEIITPESTGLVPITVVDANGNPEILNGNSGAEPVSFTYDINVTADDRIFVRGRGLESEWRADIRTVSQRGEPLLIGDVRLRRGTFDFSGRRFDLTRGRITFDRLSTNNPLLDIRAEYETNEGVTAIIAVSGRGNNPTIELLSTPSLPSADVMALVLFGKPAEELSAVESLQTAQALASLGGIGPFAGDGGGVIGSLRDSIGLDMLNFDIDPESGGGSLTVGKYVADGFFVSATQDAQGQNGAVRVEYELTDNISVETEIKQDGDQTVSANWKKDF